MTNIFVKSAGLFTESDILSLSDTVRLSGVQLIDSANNAHHVLSSKVRPLIVLIQQPVSVSTIEKYSQLRLEEIVSALSFLDTIGALEITRSRFQKISIFHKRLACLLKGISFRTNAHRRRATLMQLQKVIIGNLLYLAIPVFITSLLWYGANLPMSSFIYSNIILIVTIYLSTLTHELVHIYFSVQSQYQPMILTRGMRMGIIHEQLNAKTEIFSAVGGPLLGFVTCLVVSIIVKMLFAHIEYAAIPLFVALIHFASLTPSYGDGQVLQNVLQRSKYATTT